MAHSAVEHTHFSPRLVNKSYLANILAHMPSMAFGRRTLSVKFIQKYYESFFTSEANIIQYVFWHNFVSHDYDTRLKMECKNWVCMPNRQSRLVVLVVLLLQTWKLPETANLNHAVRYHKSLGKGLRPTSPQISENFLCSPIYERTFLEFKNKTRKLPRKIGKFFHRQEQTICQRKSV